MARPERLELPTPWFEARYSIQLSYGRIEMRRHDYRELTRYCQTCGDPCRGARDWGMISHSIERKRSHYGLFS